MKRIKIFNKKLVKIFLILIFLSMLILNYLTPILADDYSYSIAYDYTRILKEKIYLPGFLLTRNLYFFKEIPPAPVSKPLVPYISEDITGGSDLDSTYINREINIITIQSECFKTLIPSS